MKILAISGSLRAASSNSLLIEALPALSPAGTEIVVYRGLGSLPHFNPDLDGDTLPEQAGALRRLVGETDALIICSPEYARGVAGAMKNALDWLVPSIEFPGTPVALINVAPHAHHAVDQMRGTLEMMQAQIVEDASIAISIHGRRQVSEIVGDAELARALRAALVALTLAAAEKKEAATHDD
jgi:NAD(P)H-dependent FMN reductase